MDETIKNLEGSKLRDRWRLLHKQKLGDGYYGLDGDFFFVVFGKGVVACLDLKSQDDSVTSTEAEAYAFFERKGIPVYIVTIIDVVKGTCMIKRFGEGFPEAICNDWEDFRKWEEGFR